MVTCKICNREFNSNRMLSYHIKKEHPDITIEEYIDLYLYNEDVKCPICGSHRKRRGFVLLETCGNKECKMKKIENSIIDKYGVTNVFSSPEIKEKIKKTNLEKYGVEIPSQNKDIKIKTKNAINKKYGVDHYSKTEEFKDKFKQTCLDKYGVENVSQLKSVKNKKKETCEYNYNTSNPSQSEEIKKKIKNTINKKYGVDNVSQNDNIKDKKKETCIKNYGVDNPLKVNDIQNKIKNNNLNKYGVEYYTQTDEYKSNVHDVKLEIFLNNVSNNRPDVEFISLTDKYYYTHYICKWKCKQCETEFEDYARSTAGWAHPRCPKCNPVSYSSIENKIYNYLLEIGIIKDQIIRNDRSVIKPYELDLYIPSKRFAIECDGLYWHRDEYMLKRYNMTSEEHKQLKLQLCKDKGITLLHFEEEEINNEFDKVKDVINNYIK